MVEFLGEEHFSPVATDSTLASESIIRFFEAYDPGSMRLDQLTREEIKSKWPILLTEILNGDCSFSSTLIEVIRREEKELLESFATENFWNFDYDENLTQRSSKVGFPYHQDLLDQWRAIIQFQTFILHSRQGQDFEDYIAKFDSLKTVVRGNWDCRVRSESNDAIRQKLYQSVLSGFDPHTQFFDKGTLERFSRGLSSGSHGLGFTVNRDFLGEIKVNEVFPNGPASRKGIAKGTRILSMKTRMEDHDLRCIKEDEVE